MPILLLYYFPKYAIVNVCYCSFSMWYACTQKDTITYSTLYSQKQNWLTLVFCLAENLLKMRKVTWIEYHILLLHCYYYHHLFADYSLRDSQQLLSRLSFQFCKPLEKKVLHTFIAFQNLLKQTTQRPDSGKNPGPRKRPLESFSSFVFHPSTHRPVEIVLKEELLLQLCRNYCILRTSTTTTIAV